MLLELREKLLGVYVVGEGMEGFLDRLIAVLKVTNLKGGGVRVRGREGEREGGGR